MGNGISGGSTARSATAARLILLDGELQELFSPIKISKLLTLTPETFICSSDQMDFGEFPLNMRGEEELRPGQLYFELPVAWLKRRLQAEDMAALAVKASVALATSDDVRCGCYHAGIKRRVEPLVFVDDDYWKPRENLILSGRHEIHYLGRAAAGVAGGVGKRKSRNFAANLTIIREE